VEPRHSQSRIPLSWYEPNQTGFRYVVWDQPYDTLSVSPSAGHSISIESQTFWFGTDLMGRDLLSRLLLGMRSTLKIGVFAVLVSLLVGIFIGMLAGYFGGKVDQILTWLMQVVWSVPSIMLVIAFSLALGRGAWQVYLAVGLTLWVDVARLVRGEARRLREQEFVQAAQVLGYSSIRIMMHHLLPNMLGPILIMAAAQFASAILVESGLSFLGLGIQPPAPSLGMMIREHYPYILTRSAWLAIAPGVVISLMVLTCNLLSTGMSDLLGRVEKKS
jgi:peptide/nickel transport system permease protein